MAHLSMTTSRPSATELYQSPLNSQPLEHSAKELHIEAFTDCFAENAIRLISSVVPPPPPNLLFSRASLLQTLYIRASYLLTASNVLLTDIHSSDPSELLQWLCHDDSTINIVFAIMITFTVIIGGVCQWLERRSLADRLSLICA